MAKKKSDKNINISIGGDAQSTTIIVGDSNVVGPGTQKSADIKSRFLVPFPHNPDFVGRDEELSSLHEMLQQKQSIVGIRPTVLVGLGGIGKTQLTVEYAHAYRDNYPSGVFWLNAINPLLIEFSDLAEKLEMSDRDTPRDKAARKAWDYLDAHPDALLIFDNVLEPSELNVPFSPDLVPANLRCRTLFTTRQRNFPRTFQPFEVKVLPEMAAMHLLLRSRLEVLEEHHPEWGWARIVCAYLGWLPLALELAAAYLGAYPEVSLTGYLERLRNEGSLDTVDQSEVRAIDLPTRVEEILKAAAAGNLELKHQVAVSATLQTQWKRLDDDDARLLFRAAGQFPEASWIPIPRLGLLTGIESEAKAGRPSPLNVALKKLHSVSLIEELSEDRLRLHPLVQEFAVRLAQEPTSFRLEMAERVAAEFNDLLRLQARVIDYGIDMVLQDLRTGLGFCIDKKETETYSLISKMERVLDRQAHWLRNWNAQEQPAYFFQQIQQICDEPFAKELKQWQVQAQLELVTLGRPYLIERFPIHAHPSELRTLAGHTGPVNNVALSADGQVAVSASDDKTIKVWDITTGRELRTLSGHSDSVRRVALSADGRVAVSASGDKTLKVWDVATGRELRTLTGHREWVNGVALSANGRLVVSASEDKTIKVWDIATGSELQTLVGHCGSVGDVALNANGWVAVSASTDGTLKVWDVATGCERRTLTGCIGMLSGIALSADGQVAVSASSYGFLQVWDVATGHELRTLSGHRNWVRSVALSGDAQLAVSASDDKTIKVWDVLTGRELHTLPRTSGFVNDVALSADGRLAISISEGNCLKVWDIVIALTLSPQESEVKEINLGTMAERRLNMFGGPERVLGIAMSANGQLAVSASADKTIKVWDVPTGRELRTLKGHSEGVLGVALSADGQLTVSASADKTLKVWDVPTGRELRTLTGHSEGVLGVALSADGQLAVSASADKTIKVWDVLTGRELRTLLGHSDFVRSVALSADGRLAISASYDKTIKVWNVPTGHELLTLVESCVQVALSADGWLAISASDDKIIKAWNILTVLNPIGVPRRELRTLQGHNNRVSDVALSADGRLAISASEDKTIKVWDVTTGICTATFLLDTILSCCALAIDEKTIVTGDQLGRIHFLELIDKGEITTLRKE